MKQIVIDSLYQFHQEFCEFRGKQLIYRGVKSAKYELIPSIGRMTHIPARERKETEVWMFDDFKRRSAPHTSMTLKNDWEWLAYAQHYGLPTRLLDWSENPLIAAYFATNDFFDGDSAVYAYEAGLYLTAEDVDESPFKISETFQFVPSFIDKRITAQSGVFTFHHKPFEKFKSASITKFIIKNEIRGHIKRSLNQYGVNAATVFPGPDGIAQQIRWDQSSADTH